MNDKLTAKEIWNNLKDIPVDKDDNIECNFMHFKKGDNKFDIWHWIEDSYPNTSIHQLMQNEYWNELITDHSLS